MANFQKFIKRSTKGIFLGIIVIMVVSLTISFSPGGGMGGGEDSGDAGIIFDDVTVSNEDLKAHISRATGHLRYAEFRRYMKFNFQEQLNRKITGSEIAAFVSRSIKLTKDSERKAKAWENIILLQDAKDKGVAVSEEEAGKAQDEFISHLGSDGKNLADQFLGVDRYGIKVFFREALMMEKLLDLVSQSQFPSYQDIYGEILSGTEEGRIRYTSLNPHDAGEFLDLIARVHPEWISQFRKKRVKQSKITDYYEKNKWRFEIPAKIQAFWLLADFDEIRKSLAGPTGEEAKKYYDENRDSFIKTPASGDGPKIYKTLQEATEEVTLKWKTRQAKVRSNEAMRGFEKWLSAQPAESVRVEYLLVDLEGIAATMTAPTQAEKEKYFQDHRGEFEKEGKTLSLDAVDSDVAKKILDGRARTEATRLATLAEKLIAGFQEKRKGRRRNFMPSVAASLRKSGPSPVESVLKKYYENHKDDFGSPGNANHKPFAAARIGIISLLREGKVLLGLSEELKATSSVQFRKFGEIVGKPVPEPKNWREALPRSWAFSEGRRVREVSPSSETTRGIVLYRLKKKIYGTKILEDFRAKAKRDYGIEMTTGITSYFDKDNMKEVYEIVGEDVVRGTESTLSTWGFATREQGDLSRQMETSKGYIVYRLQGMKDKYVPEAIIGSVRERIMKILLKDQMKDRSSQLATEISADINLHGLAHARRKFAPGFKRSGYFKLNGTDSALPDDAALGREISRQVAQPELPVGESRVFDGSRVTGKTDWSFVVYMEDRIDRAIDSAEEQERFDALRTKKEREIREQYKKDYVELVVNRANRKDLLDSEGESR